MTVAEDTIEAYVAPIAELLGSSAAWQAMADRARARGTELQWPAQGKKLVAAYRELAAR